MNFSHSARLALTSWRLLSLCLLALNVRLYTWTKHLMWIILPFLIEYLPPGRANVCCGAKLRSSVCRSALLINLFIWRRVLKWRVSASATARKLNCNIRMLSVSAETHRLQRISEVRCCACVRVFRHLHLPEAALASGLGSGRLFFFPPRSCHFLSNKLSSRPSGPAGAASLRARPSAGRRRRASIAQVLTQQRVEDVGRARDLMEPHPCGKF